MVGLDSPALATACGVLGVALSPGEYDPDDGARSGDETDDPDYFGHRALLIMALLSELGKTLLFEAPTDDMRRGKKPETGTQGLDDAGDHPEDERRDAPPLPREREPVRHENLHGAYHADGLGRDGDECTRPDMTAIINAAPRRHHRVLAGHAHSVL